MPTGEPAKRTKQHIQDNSQQGNEKGAGEHFGIVTGGISRDEQLAKAGKDGRQEGCGETAAVQGSGVRPDPASVHDGRRSSSGWVVREAV